MIQNPGEKHGMAKEGQSEGEGRSVSKSIKLLEEVAKFSGKVAGGAAAVTVVQYGGGASFAGVWANALVGTAVEKAGLTVIQRFLGPRQGERVAKTIEVTASRMAERAADGETPRKDPFVQPRPDGRSDAEEAVEAALLAAMNSAEEKKIDFIGLLLASITYDSSITASNAQVFIAIAEALRFRSYVILKIAYDVHIHGWPSRGGEDVAGPPDRLYPLMSEIYDMARRGLIELKDKPEDDTTYAVLGVDNVDPSRLHLSPLGRALYQNMELHRLLDTDEIYRQTKVDLEELSNYGKGLAKIEGSIDDGKF